MAMNQYRRSEANIWVIIVICMAIFLTQVYFFETFKPQKSDSFRQACAEAGGYVTSSKLKEKCVKDLFTRKEYEK